MVARNRSATFLVTAGAILGYLVSAAAQEVSVRFIHTGKVLSYADDSAVEATVKAWRSSAVADAENVCFSLLGDPLDSRVSDRSSGDFEIEVDRSFSTYLIVYCANGFFPRVDLDNPNFRGGQFVVPTPARLFPIEGTADPIIDASNDLTVLGDEVIRSIAESLNSLAYLQAVDIEAFDVAVQQYTEMLPAEGSQQRQAVATLLEAVQLWSAFRR